MKGDRIIIVGMLILCAITIQDMGEIVLGSNHMSMVDNQMDVEVSTNGAVFEPVWGEQEVQPRIALTFDDGPSDMEGGTEYLLDGLKKRNVRATFFVLGERAEVNPNIMKRLVDEGHLVGNHTYSHVDLSTLSEEQMYQELEKTSEVVKELTDVTIEYMRPPYGAWNKEQEKLIDMVPVLWTVDSLDWTTNNVEQIVNKVVTDIEENDIILMHDCYKSSSDAAFQIIDILQEQGYAFVTVEELFMD